MTVTVYVKKGRGQGRPTLSMRGRKMHPAKVESEEPKTPVEFPVMCSVCAGEGAGEGAGVSF